MLSVSPASACVPVCSGVCRLLSPGLICMAGQHSGTLSVVCVAGVRLCSGAPRRVPAAVSAFVWQGRRLGTLSVVCVAGVRLFSGVSRRVPVAVSRGKVAWQGQHLGALVSCLCRGGWVCVAGAAFRHRVCCLCHLPCSGCCLRG